jgi:hypothetical protein
MTKPPHLPPQFLKNVIKIPQFGTQGNFVKHPGAIAGHQWLTPVIPATQEAEITRVVVEASPDK